VAVDEVGRMTLSSDERTRLKKQRTEQAIQFAIQSRWEDAAAVNRQLLQVFPNDTEAWNRLGKALGELGRYDDARGAYEKTIEIDPVNQIARKNIKRLEGLGGVIVAPVQAQAIDPSLFIEETGKSGQSALLGADPALLRVMNAGEKVALTPVGGTLTVATARGEPLGGVDPKVGLRLVRLMEGGNQYDAVITSTEGGGRILIKETYQHPSQLGRISFPPVGGEAFRGHTRESLLRHDGDDGDERAVDDGSEEWTEGSDEEGGGRSSLADSDGEDRDVSFYDVAAAEARDPEDEPEE
jgi:hypothetical protein